MRKHHIRQIFELLKIMKHAQQDLRFEDCLDGALSILEFLGSHGDGFPITSSLISEYCQLLPKSGGLPTGVAKRLRRQMAKIGASANSELKPNRIEALFLSYKASMSDCLESIYFSALEDPRCDAFWMPIPYFDRRPDGSVGEWHYEGSDFYPNNIQCTDWREYDIASRHPDVIFVYNPYDANNLVTSVHPDYYSERLRSSTDLLVYVPYFIVSDCVGRLPDHFCTTPGCVFAHRVFLQSVKICKVYISAYKNAYGNRLDLLYGKPEEKFVALGSPKFDKVLSSQRQDHSLPDGWKEIVGERKVVLYNSSLGTILSDTGQYLKKLHHVLETFQSATFKDSMVLWWRPHPLSGATYRSMRPEHLAEYDRIVSDFRSSAFGVYDDTPDLHRAIAFADGYFGDTSSLVPLFQAAMKPVLIQSIPYIPESQLFGTVQFDALFDDGEHFWLTSHFLNALFRMDSASLQIEYIGSFQDEYFLLLHLFCKIISIGNKLIFVPLSAKHLHILDRRTGIFSKVPIDPPRHLFYSDDYIDLYKFCSAVAFSKWVFMIPSSYPAIAILDTATNVIDYYDDFIPSIRTRLKENKQFCFVDAVAIGSKIFCACLFANAVLAFDMSDCSYEIFDIGNYGRGFSTISFDGEYVWLTPVGEGPIIKWVVGTSTFHKFSDFPPGYSGTGVSFRYSHYLRGHIWSFPRDANMILKTDVKTGAISEAIDFPVKCNPQAKLHYSNVPFSCVDGDKIFALINEKNQFVVHDCAINESAIRTIVLDPSAIDSLRPLVFNGLDESVGMKHQGNALPRENSLLDLEHFCGYLLSGRSAAHLGNPHSDPVPNVSAGAAIYKHCSDTFSA